MRSPDRSAACLRYHEWSLQRRAATYCDCWSCYGRYADRVAAGVLRPEDPKTEEPSRV